MNYDQEMKQRQAVSKIIDKVGSSKKLAELLGISRPYVANFLAADRPIPLKYIRKLVELSDGEVKKKDLRPDLYDIE